MPGAEIHNYAAIQRNTVARLRAFDRDEIEAEIRRRLRDVAARAAAYAKLDRWPRGTAT